MELTFHNKPTTFPQVSVFKSLAMVVGQFSALTELARAPDWRFEDVPETFCVRSQIVIANCLSIGLS